MIYFNVDMLVSIYMCETEKNYISFKDLESLTAHINKNIFKDKLNLTIFSSEFFVEQMLNTHRDLFKSENDGIKLQDGISATRLKRRLTDFLDEQKVVAPLRKYVKSYVDKTNKVEKTKPTQTKTDVTPVKTTAPKAKTNGKL